MCAHAYVGTVHHHAARRFILSYSRKYKEALGYRDKVHSKLYADVSKENVLLSSQYGHIHNGIEEKSKSSQVVQLLYKDTELYVNYAYIIEKQILTVYKCTQYSFLYKSDLYVSFNFLCLQ